MKAMNWENLAAMFGSILGLTYITEVFFMFTIERNKVPYYKFHFDPILLWSLFIRVHTCSSDSL